MMRKERVCNGCKEPLISGENWSPSNEKRQANRCKACECSRARAARQRNGNATFKKWAAANLPRVMWHSAKKRATEYGIPFDIEIDDIEIPEVCPILGIVLERGSGKGGNESSPTLDRIVPSRGYVAGNIVVISARANRLKDNATIDELTAVLDWLKSKLSSQ